MGLNKFLQSLQQPEVVATWSTPKAILVKTSRELVKASIWPSIRTLFWTGGILAFAWFFCGSAAAQGLDLPPNFERYIFLTCVAYGLVGALLQPVTSFCIRFGKGQIEVSDRWIRAVGSNTPLSWTNVRLAWFEASEEPGHTKLFLKAKGMRTYHIPDEIFESHVKPLVEKHAEIRDFTNDGRIEVKWYQSLAFVAFTAIACAAGIWATFWFNCYREACRNMAPVLLGCLLLGPGTWAGLVLFRRNFLQAPVLGLALGYNFLSFAIWMLGMLVLMMENIQWLT